MNLLLDPALGPVSNDAAAAITGICDDALQSVLGHSLAREALDDPGLLARIAPWARDLARGLQYRDRYGTGDPLTIELVARFSASPLSGDQACSLSETVDLAVVLTLGRVTDQVLGEGSGARHPVANALAAPWLAALQLGYRIGLALEILRLSAPGT